MGEIIDPKKKPNFIQALFGTVNIFEFSKPKIKNIKEIIKNKKEIFSLLRSGQKPKIKKNIKKTIPKLLFDDLLCIIIFLIFLNIKNYSKMCY
tara:strand:+ start:42 stop:320 length:279 start_codon:yes stop_codon:yes gene_type:complete